MTKTKQMQSQNTSLFRTLVLLSIPTVLEQVLSTLLQYVDTAMVDHLGEQATAAVSTTTTITWLVNSVPGAIGTAVLVLISRAAGAGDKAQVKKLAEQGLFLAVSAGVALTGVSLALSPWIPVWMGAEAAVQPNASRYFFIVSVPLLFRCVSSVMGSALRGVQNTKTPMLISVAENGLNILLNSILIYGLDLGVTGAAIASAVAYTLSGVLMFAACRKNKQLCWQWRTFSLSPKLLKACANLGVPVLGSSMVSCLGYVVFASLVSGMGTTVFAAHSIAVTAETIFYVPGYGLRTAASTLIGNARGEGNTEKLKSVARLSVLLTVGMMCISGVALFFGAQALMRLFSPSAAVVELGAQMLRLVALSEPFYGLMIVLEGIFYGLGRTRYAFFAEAFGMWCVRILFTALCVNVWGLGLRAVWYCMIADNVCKAVLFAVPFLKKRSRERLLSSRESESANG